MAKAKTGITDNSADNIFAQLLSSHNKVSSGSAAMGNEMQSEVTDWIDSGGLLLNMILSNKPDGGWPCKRIVEVFGQESIGKSTLGYVAMASAQKAGGIVIYADIERAGNKQFMDMIGVDLSRLVTTNEETIEKLFEALEENLKTIIQSPYKDKPNLIVVDSVTSLQTDAELEQGYAYNMNIQMKKAMMLGKAIKKIVPYLNKANCCLYLVNQIRDNTTGYGEKYITSGGHAIPFYSSIRLNLKGKSKIEARDASAENEYQEQLAIWKNTPKDLRGEKPVRAKLDTITIGYRIEAFTKKNKTAPPDRTAHFNIIFKEGIIDVDCYLEYCERFGIVKGSGAWKEFVHPTITSKFPDLPKFYASDWIKILQEKEGLYEEVEKMLIDKLTIKSQIVKEESNEVVKGNIETLEEEDDSDY